MPSYVYIYSSGGHSADNIMICLIVITFHNLNCDLFFSNFLNKKRVCTLS